MIQLFPEVTDLKIAILTLFGWQVVEQHPGMLSCEACHTQCTFLPSADTSNNTVDVDDDMEGAREDDMDDFTGFDVAHAHKWYCYWVDPEYDRRGGCEGWKIFLDLVMSISSRSVIGSGDTTSNGPSRLKVN